MPGVLLHGTARPRLLRLTGIGALVLLTLSSPAPAGEPRVSVIGGVVFTEEGQPLGDAEVRIRQGDRLVATASTDEEGRFAVPLDLTGDVDVFVGRCFVTWTPEGRPSRRWVLSATASPVAGDVRDLVLVAKRSRPVARRVRVSASTPTGPLQGVSVVFWPEPLRGYEGGRRSDEQGLAEARCRLSSDEGPLGVLVFPPAPWAPALVDRAPLDEAPIPVALRRARIVTGRVLDARGEPVATVGVLPAGPEQGTARPWGDVTGPDGSFRVGVPEDWSSFTLRVGSAEPFASAPCVARVAVALDRSGEVRPVEVRLVDGLAPAVPLVAPREAETPRDAEIRAVSSAVLRYVTKGETPKRLVLSTRNGNLPVLLDAWSMFGHAELRGVSEATRRDFEARNEIRVEPPRGLDPGFPVVLLSPGWVRHLALGGAGEIWSRFATSLRAYGGLLELSAVGFNEDRTQAMVRVGRARGYLSGTGYDYLLVKEEGAWRVVAENLVWVS